MHSTKTRTRALLLALGIALQLYTFALGRASAPASNDPKTGAFISANGQQCLQLDSTTGSWQKPHGAYQHPAILYVACR